MINKTKLLTYNEKKECIYFFYDFGQIFSKSIDKYEAPSKELDKIINQELALCKNLRKLATHYFFFYNKKKFIQACIYESWVMAISGALRDEKASNEITTMIYEWIDEVG